MKSKHLLQTLFAAALFTVATAIIPGCAQKPDTISGNVIIKQYNKQLAQNAADRYVVEIKVGQYEANDTERAKLRELEAAGLITYNVTRYAWWEKKLVEKTVPVTVTRYYYYWSYNDTEYRTVKKPDYEFCDHYVVDIALTEKGKKLVTEAPAATEEIDADMVQPTVDASKYAWNQKDLSEEWPYIENPFIEKTPADTTSPRRPADKKSETKKPATVKADPITRIDSLQYKAFQNLDFESEEVCLKAFEIAAVKARNIRIHEEDGYPKCTAEVIVSCKNVTDAGRLFFAAENGMKMLNAVELDYFVDKGWVMTSKPSDDAALSLPELTTEEAEYDEDEIDF